MSSIHQLKRRIGTTKNISKITKAMEMVAASKMKKAQDQAISSRPYAQALFASLQMLASKTDANLHPLLSFHKEGRDLAILISTDKGLCGGLNTSLFKSLSLWAKQHPEPLVLAVGKKAVNFAHNYGFDLHAQFTDIPDKISTNDLLPISSLIIEGFLNNTFRGAHLFYTDFINTLSQQTKIEQLLPLQQPASDQKQLIKHHIEPIYVFEPSAKQVLTELLPYYVENSIFQALLEAKASEHSARMVAMKSASENANELMQELQLIFNKTRQENITTELLEMTSATMTLN